ncbi:redoxin domain-containing protein [Lacinutrix iliipiscaria]|uniref:Redoxin domain-containing protein n=1 Tax=Lacinutrix iliipiscaria TaxID=1230532 RepID=A0ABW5WP18_9FLAO
MNIRILLILCVFVFGCKNENKTEELPVVAEKVNDQSEDYNLEVYNFEEFEKFINLSDDTTYVVNFWATWCAPCIKELPYFEQLNDRYQDKKVKVLLVSLDFPKLYEKKLIPYITKHKLKSKVIALNDPDSNSWIPKVNENWSGAIPATLIYNKNKRQFYEQSFNYDELKTEVEQFLK